MNQNDNVVPRNGSPGNHRDGVLSALVAYSCWGFLPVYFVLVKTVSSWEVLAHRAIWAVPFGALIIYLRRQWPEVSRAFQDRRILIHLFISALLIAANWLIYIVAVQTEQIFQASLGYYINPLFFALAGVYLFGETLRSMQLLAIILAGLGVTVLTISGGGFPTIAILLGSLFTIYGVIRKKIDIGGMPGLFVETVLLFPVAMTFLLWLMHTDQAQFSAERPGLSVLLVLAGPLTVIPLLFFALAAKRLNLSTVGMMQFLAPTLQFLVGLYFGEQLTPAHVICFACIWAAVAIFSWDAWGQRRLNTRISAT